MWQKHNWCCLLLIDISGCWETNSRAPYGWEFSISLSNQKIIIILGFERKHLLNVFQPARVWFQSVWVLHHFAQCDHQEDKVQLSKQIQNEIKLLQVTGWVIMMLWTKQRRQKWVLSILFLWTIVARQSLKPSKANEERIRSIVNKCNNALSGHIQPFTAGFLTITFKKKVYPFSNISS